MSAVSLITSRPNVARLPRSQGQRLRHIHRRNIVASAESSSNTDQPQQKGVEYTLTIRKPLGLVLAETNSRNDDYHVFVEEINPTGNAAATGKIQVNDVIKKTSAIVLKSGQEGAYEREGYGNRVYDNWETIEFDCKGQDFNTVMAAIGSNNERWGIMNVTLTFYRE